MPGPQRAPASTGGPEASLAHTGMLALEKLSLWGWQAKTPRSPPKPLCRWAGTSPRTGSSAPCGFSPRAQVLSPVPAQHGALSSRQGPARPHCPEQQLCCLVKEQGADVPALLPGAPDAIPPFPTSWAQAPCLRGGIKKPETAPRRSKAPSAAGAGWSRWAPQGFGRASVSHCPQSPGTPQGSSPAPQGLILSQKPQILSLSPLHPILHSARAESQRPGWCFPG